MISGKDFILVTVSDKGSYILYKDKIKDILSYMVNSCFKLIKDKVLW